MNRTLAFALSAALFLVPAAAKNKPGPDPAAATPDPGKGLNFYSMEQEIALGRQMSQDVELQSRLCDDAVVNEYVNRLAQNIGRNADSRFPLTVKVIDSDEVNAFALPGGFVYVNTGLVLNADNEAELAAVLAHEIAHVAARHGTKQATRGQLLQYAALPLIFVGGSAGLLIYEAATLAAPIEFSHFSRGMEMEADTLGLKYVYQSGYDPAAFVDFFEKLQSQQKKNPNVFARAFSSHPMNNSRIRHAQVVIQNDLRPEPRYVLDTSEFHAVRERLEAARKRREAYRSYPLPALRPRPEMK